jgi:hypothetical protein
MLMKQPDVPRRRPQPQPSPARQRLAAMMQALEFGCIDGLRVVNGEPQSSPRPRRKRIVNLAADGIPSAKQSGRAFRLRSLDALFRRLDSITGTAMVSIVVQHGLPVRLTIEEPDEA